ncbi:MAG: hypothetical protein HC933_10100 [Pleurocapsa sp. SU_196_0]|nr:hypothetical protein [Pleurocapsa sp. SU_196_0]
MKKIVVDIETSLTFANVKARTSLEALQPTVFALHPWIAVTRTEDGEVEEWDSGLAIALLETLQRYTVIGWNIRAFDLPIIAQTAILQGMRTAFEPLEFIDVFDAIHRVTRVMFKLEEIAQLNFGEGKLGDSATIPAAFAAGHFDAIFAHCARDVDLEWRVYQAALTGLKLPAVPASKWLPEQTFTLPTP